MTNMTQPMSVLTSQTTQEWYTPPYIIERARSLLGTIDLDPCSAELPQTWIKATTYYTLDRPAKKPWSGRVWLNPPFDDTKPWIENLEKRFLEVRNNRHLAVSEALALVNSALGYKWYEELWINYAVCCLRDRLCFVNEQGKTVGQAKKGQTIVYFGYRYSDFRDCFGDLGRILIP